MKYFGDAKEKHGFDFEYCDDEGNTALHHLAQSQKVATPATFCWAMRVLLKNTPAHWINQKV